MDLINQIEEELKQKPRNAGELRNATKASYPEIFAALRQMCHEGKAAHYFNENTLTYRLKAFWEQSEQ